MFSTTTVKWAKSWPNLVELAMFRQKLKNLAKKELDSSNNELMGSNLFLSPQIFSKFVQLKKKTNFLLVKKKFSVSQRFDKEIIKKNTYLLNKLVDSEFDAWWFDLMSSSHCYFRIFYYKRISTF